MKKTLTLNSEKALKLYKTADESFKSLLEENFGKEFFKPKLIYDIVFDIDSLCEYLNIDESDLFIFNKNTRDKHERYLNACNILPKIAKIYNEKTILDWNNTNIYKYLPYLYVSGGSLGVCFSYCWAYGLDYPIGFYYKTSELSQKSYENFKSYFEDFWGMKANK